MAGRVRRGLRAGRGGHGRRAARSSESAREAGLVDWRRVEDIAIARLRNAPGTLTAHELRATEAAYAEAMAKVVPALAAHLGTELPGVVDRVAVVDRAGWVRANTDGVRGAHRPARGRAARPDAPAGQRVREGGR